LGAYSDSDCTIPIGPINWGILWPGASTSQTVYIKNIGVGLSLILTMSANNWNPMNANEQITLMWDQEGTILKPGESVTANLTLSVSLNVSDITDFNVQIGIFGTHP
jgi:hypothetical protein